MVQNLQINFNKKHGNFFNDLSKKFQMQQCKGKDALPNYQRRSPCYLIIVQNWHGIEAEFVYLAVQTLHYIWQLVSAKKRTPVLKLCDLVSQSKPQGLYLGILPLFSLCIAFKVINFSWIFIFIAGFSVLFQKL